MSRGSLGRLFLQRRCFGEQWFVSLQNKCRVSSRAGPPILKLVLNCAGIGSEFSTFWCFLLFLVFAVETPKELWRGTGCQTTPSPGQRWVWVIPLVESWGRGGTEQLPGTPSCCPHGSSCFSFLLHSCCSKRG